MADTRIKEYWSNEVDALLGIYKQFQVLLPAENRAGALHVGEDGRYVEHLLKEYLKRFLPRDLEILTGFILRPAVNCGSRGKARKKDEHEASGQLDIIIYDTAHYPVYQRFGDSAIVPPEGVIAIISVKKHLKINDIKHELEMLGHATSLCPHKCSDKGNARIPFTALLTIEDKIGEKNKIKLTAEQKGAKVYKKLETHYKSKSPLYYDEMVDFIGSLSEWGIYKERIAANKKTSYYFYEYDSKNKSLGFQLVLQNILSVYYENTSQYILRPGFTDNCGEGYKRKWGEIEYNCEKIVRK